jgi:ribosomal protein S18 acetylase RimI-like enzyme
MRLGPLRPHDRVRLAELLSATAAFSDDEVTVALELFDLAHDAAAVAGGRAASSATVGDDLADYEFVGAFDEVERLVGYACFGPTPATEGTFDLYWLAVDPLSQGHGVGRTLVRWVEQELRQRRGRLLVVETSSRPDYANTREFYARGGYAEAARVRNFYAPADDRIILTTRLTPPRVGGVATQ